MNSIEKLREIVDEMNAGKCRKSAMSKTFCKPKKP